MIALGHEVTFAHIERELGDRDAMKTFWGDRYRPIAYPSEHRVQRSLIQRALKRLGLSNPHNYRLDDFYSESVNSQLQALAEEISPQVAWVEYVFMSAALLNFPDSVWRIVDTHDVFSDRYKRFLSQGQKPQWFSTSAKEEKQGLSRADAVVAIQSLEAEFFRNLGLKNVVTLGDFVPLTAPSPTRNQVPGSLLLVGSANSSNVHSAEYFIKQCLPIIKKEVPGVELMVVGGLSKELQPQQGVRLLGRVENLDDCYSQAQVVINPVQFGSGLKIKTMEALGFARALVTTQLGGEGLEDGWHSAFCVADTAPLFAAAVVQLLQDKQGREALENRAFEYARRTNQNNVQMLEKLLG